MHVKTRMSRNSFKAILIALALVSGLEASADAYSRISLTENNVSVEEVLKKIEQQAQCLFVFNTQIDTQRSVNLDVQDKPVSEVLDLMFKGTNVTYSIQNPNIVLSQSTIQVATETPKTNSRTTNDRIVTGTVTDSSGETLIGLAIRVVGTTIGTTTDFDGNYSINLPSGSNQLEFTYIGYQPMTVSVDGRSKIDIVMESDVQALEEVVVTALGIERKATSLTYATQKVGGEELTRAKDANFINSLQGKTSGLVITPNASGAGGSSKLLLRGNSSILGSNSPLIVIDGVPMADRSTTQIGDALLSGGNTTDGGDGLSNINPDDIESITVLKGANAAALYGSRAANGVLIITTKKGEEGRISVDVSSSILFETPLLTPEFQNTYGAAVENYLDSSLNPNNSIQRRRLNMYSWGPRLGTYSDVDLASIPYMRNYALNNVNNYLQTGTNFNNSISVTAGTKVAQTYVSYGNTLANGIMPSNEFVRHNFTVRQTVSLWKDRAQIDFSGNYIQQTAKNRPGSGIYGNPLYDLYLMPRNADIRYFENNSEIEGDLYYINSVGGTYKSTGVKGPIQQWPWSDNENRNSPYWLNNRITREQVRERLLATIGLKVNIIDGLSAQVRFKIDRTTDTNENKTWQGTRAKTYYNSVYEYAKISNNQMFSDFLISYAKKVGEFDLSANLGGSTMLENYADFGINYWMNDSTSTPNIFDPSNVKSPSNTGTYKSKDQNWENALYATASIGYRGMAYIDASVRTDWSRTYTQFAYLGTPDHYTYYSVGGNVLLNPIFGIESDWFNHSKLRVSYSEVGNSIPNLNYGGKPTNWGSQIVSASAYREFLDPRPETMRSTEAGLDGRLFRNALDFDVTYYHTMMLNQWLPQTAATGGNLPLNSGKIRNQGVELTLGYNWQITKDLLWRTGINYSYNTNEVLETYGEKKNSVIEQTPIYQGGLKVRYEVGKPYGELYGRRFKKDSEGNIMTDRFGAPMLTSTYDEYLGNANAPHHLGWNNTFSYKGFSLYFLIDGKIGGTVISYTEARLDAYGVSKRSGDARNSGITYIYNQSVGGSLAGVAVPGVIMPDGNVAPAQGYYTAIGSGEPALGEYAYDATNFRLREVSFGYTFRNLLGEGKHLSLSAVGRNLCFLYRESPVDPDISVSTANSYGGLEAFSIPTTRSYGLNLKVTF